MDDRERLERDGFLWLREALSADELERLRGLSQDDGRPGARIEHADPLFEAVVRAGFGERIRALRPSAAPVRMLTFNKFDSNQTRANWALPWHHDRVIAVAERQDVPGYGNWTRKDGAWHCEPPEDVLASMLFVRVHLDASTRDNGAMEIALGSHRCGKAPSDRVAEIVASCVTAITEVEAGDVLVLAMLTLHRSLPSRSADSRRTLRVDYAAEPLPSPLEWATGVQT